jgi:hypothetical protein
VAAIDATVDPIGAEVARTMVFGAGTSPTGDSPAVGCHVGGGSAAVCVELGVLSFLKTDGTMANTTSTNTEAASTLNASG